MRNLSLITVLSLGLLLVRAGATAVASISADRAIDQDAPTTLPGRVSAAKQLLTDLAAELASPIVFEAYCILPQGPSSKDRVQTEQQYQAAPNGIMLVDQATGLRQPAWQRWKLITDPRGFFAKQTMTIDVVGRFEDWASTTVIGPEASANIANSRDVRPRITTFRTEMSVEDRIDVAAPLYPAFAALAILKAGEAVRFDQAELTVGLAPRLIVPMGRAHPLVFEFQEGQARPAVMVYPRRQGGRSRFELYYDKPAGQPIAQTTVTQFNAGSMGDDGDTLATPGRRGLGIPHMLIAARPPRGPDEQTFEWRHFAPLAKADAADAAPPPVQYQTLEELKQAQLRIHTSMDRTPGWVLATRWGGIGIAALGLAFLAWRRWRQ